MKSFTNRVLFILCLTCVILTGGIIVSNAQTADNPKAVRHILSEIIRTKNRNKPFTILTPEDLSKFSADELTALSNSADPCDTAVPITVDQSVNGQLTNSDCQLSDGSYADFYSYTGSAGQSVTITMYSSSFDAYTGIANEDGTFVVEDDDSGDGTNALLTTTLPADGLYIILANSAFPNQFGDYSLNFNPRCTYSLSPPSATIAPEGGTYSYTINTQSGCRWAAGTEVNTFLSTNSMGIGTGTVTYTATANGFNGTRTGTIVSGGQTFTVTQPPINCAFSINPSSVTVPSAGTNTGSFTINATPGCNWIATYNGYFISTGSYGTGTGTVNYAVTTNNGADRTGTITVGGQVFTINQPGLNCTFSVSPTAINVDRFENYGSFNITTQPGCLWTAGGAPFWITLDTLSGTGSGTVNYHIYGNQYSVPRTGVIPVYGLDLIRVNVTQSGLSARTNFDFDFDGKADIAVFRPSDGVWYLNQSRNGFSQLQFGAGSDKLVPGDYDGDGKTDIAVFRGGTWYIQRSQLGFIAIPFGAADDIPVAADYDLDGKTDVAVWRPSNGTWYVYSLFNNNLLYYPVQFGAPNDKPVVGDYDGDNKADYAVYRPSNGTWYVIKSHTDEFAAAQFGLTDDKPVPADYDGDGKTDVAVFRPSNGSWYLQRSTAGFTGVQFGISTDLPTPADYDGDGKADVAVFRSGTWYLQRSTAGFLGIGFGAATDKPVPYAFVP